MIWILKVTAVLAVLFGVTALLRRATAAHRHLVWGVGLAALLIVPLVSNALPWQVPVLPAPAVQHDRAGEPPARQPAFARATDGDGAVRVTIADETPAVGTVGSGTIVHTEYAPARPFDWRGWLPIVWIAGIALLLLRVLLGMAGAWGMRRAARPLDDERWVADLDRVCGDLALTQPVELLATDAPVMPFTVGLFRPAVIVPAAAVSWTPEQRLDVLRHELAHIRRRDGLWHVIGHLACAAYWFHPLVWVAARRLRAECERACDAVVLSAGTRPSSYAQHLLDVVRRADAAAVPRPVLAMARRSEFEGRLLAILEHTGRPEAVSRFSAVAMVAIVIGLALPLAAVVPTQRPAPPAMDAPAEAATPPTDPVDDGEVRDEIAVNTRTESETDRDLDGDGATRTDTEARPAPQAASQHAAPPSLTLALIARVDDPDVGVRLEVVNALGRQPDTAAVDALSRVLRTDASPEVRRAAAWALGEIEDVRGVPALGEALGRDVDPMVRRACADALGTIESPTALEALTGTLAGERIPAVRLAIIEALGDIEDARAVPALVRATGDSLVELRVAAIEALGDIEDPSAVEPLVRQLQDPNVSVRRAVAEALGNIEDRRAVPGLLRLLDDQDLVARATAVEALGNLEDPAATDRLVQALGDRDPRVRALVAEALGDIEDARAVDGLLGVLRTDAAVVARVAAAEALGNIESLRALDGLAQALTDSAVEVRRAAADAIDNLDDVRTAPPQLISAIGDSDAQVRYYAIQAAGNIGDPAAVSALLAQLADQSVQVRRAVIGALADMETPEAYRALVDALESNDPEIRRLAARALGQR